MRYQLITNIIFFLLLQYTKPQYNPPVYGNIQQGYQFPYQNIAYPQYSNQRPYKYYENNKWMQYEDYIDYEENNCACDKCHETITKPSCRDVCPNCFTTPSPVIAPSYVFLPYPYPFQITSNTSLASTTQTIETTTASTVASPVSTTSETQTTKIETKGTRTETIKTFMTEAVTLSNSLPEENNNVLKEISPFNVKDKDPYMFTALRRTKPNWLPKYGIVPISDKFAEKIMLQLRSVKVLHPHKDNVITLEIFILIQKTLSQYAPNQYYNHQSQYTQAAFYEPFQNEEYISPKIKHIKPRKEHGRKKYNEYYISAEIDHEPQRLRCKCTCKKYVKKPVQEYEQNDPCCKRYCDSNRDNHDNRNYRDYQDNGYDFNELYPPTQDSINTEIYPSLPHPSMFYPPGVNTPTQYPDLVNNEKYPSFPYPPMYFPPEVNRPTQYPDPVNNEKYPSFPYPTMYYPPGVNTPTQYPDTGNNEIYTSRPYPSMIYPTIDISEMGKVFPWITWGFPKTTKSDTGDQDKNKTSTKDDGDSTSTKDDSDKTSTKLDRDKTNTEEHGDNTSTKDDSDKTSTKSDRDKPNKDDDRDSTTTKDDRDNTSTKRDKDKDGRDKTSTKDDTDSTQKDRDKTSTKDDQDKTITNDDNDKTSTKDDRDKTTTNDDIDQTSTKDDRDRTTTNDDKDKTSTKDDRDKTTTNDEKDKTSTKDDRDKTTTNDDKDKTSTKDDRDKITTNDDNDKTSTKDDRDKITTNDDKDKTSTNDDKDTTRPTDDIDKSTTKDDEDRTSTIEKPTHESTTTKSTTRSTLSTLAYMVEDSINKLIEYIPKRKPCLRNNCLRKNTYEKVGRYYEDDLVVRPTVASYLNGNRRRTNIQRKLYDDRPHYGIIPIPDKLAMRFLNELHN